MVGAITLSLVPVIIKARIGGGVEVETAITLVFAVGVAAGSMLAAVLSHGRIELAPAPFLLLIMGVFAIDLGAVTAALAPTSETIGLMQFFADAAGRRIVFDVLAYSCAAGLFVVPIFAAVQSWAGEDRRARVVGAVNTLSAIFMVVGSLATTLLLKLGDRPARRRQFRRGDLFLPPPASRLPGLRAAHAVASLPAARSRRNRASSPRRLAQHRRDQSYLAARRPDHPVAARRSTAAGRRRGAGAALVGSPGLETVRRAPARPRQTDCRARAGGEGA
jgi:hypothetical protein